MHYTNQQIAANIIRRITDYGPSAIDVAKLFEHHDKCDAVTSMDDGDCGVIERNDGARLALSFDIDDNNNATGWRYVRYTDEDALRALDGNVEDILTDSIDDIAEGITTCVTTWLDESFRPARHTDDLALDQLAISLAGDFGGVSVERDENGNSYVVVEHDNEYAMGITHTYSHDGYKPVFTGYACDVLPPMGESAEAEYADLDELRAALKKQEAIDPDAVVQEFVQQVDTLLGSDVWCISGLLDDVVTSWSPNDYDADRYRDKVNVMGIRRAQLGAYGEVETVEMVALGDFWGEEAENLWGENLAGQAAAWIEDTAESHQPDEVE